MGVPGSRSRVALASADGDHMIFRHCWGCMLEVTPSGRSIVLRRGTEVLLAPIEPEEMERRCAERRRVEVIRWD